MEVGETLYRGSEESVVALFGGNTGSKSSGISTSDSGRDGWFSGVPESFSGGLSSVMVDSPGLLSSPGLGCRGLSSDIPGSSRSSISSGVSGLPRCGLSKDASGLSEDGLSSVVSGLLGVGLSSNLGGFVCGLSEVSGDGLVVGGEVAAGVDVPASIIVLEGLVVCC